MKLLRRTIIFGGLFALIISILSPIVTHAAAATAAPTGTALVNAGGITKLITSMGLQPTYLMIDVPVNVSFWKFSLSFVNYALVAGLILAAFATVLRINVDTYSVKKILPAVFTGFILANMSKYICQLILQVSESIYITFQHLGGGANIGAVMLDHFQTALLAVIAVIATLVVTGPGVVLAALAAITVIIFPIIIEFCLLFLFVIRNYVVQFLVAASPVAFLLFSLPFGKSYFQKWWSQFMLWAFMKPTAFFFIMLGAVILQTGIGGSLVGFVVGLAVLCLAIYVPFKSGGLINSTMLKLAKGAGGLTRGGLVNAGAGMENYKGRGEGLINLVGKGTSWAGRKGYLPEAIKGKYDEKKKKTDSKGLAGAYAQLGDTRQVERLQNEEKAEYGKTIDDNSTNTEFREKLQAAKTNEERAAVLEKIYKSGNNESFFEELNHVDNAGLKNQLGLRGHNLQTTTGQAAAGSLLMGGNADGTGSDFAKRNNRQNHAVAFGKGQKHVGQALKPDGTVRSQTEINDAVVGVFGKGNSMSKASEARSRDWVAPTVRDATGRVTSGGFTQGWQNAAAAGHFTDMVDDDKSLEAIDGPTIQGLRNFVTNHPNGQAAGIAALNAQLSTAADFSNTDAQTRRRRQKLIQRIMGDPGWRTTTPPAPAVNTNPVTGPRQPRNPNPATGPRGPRRRPTTPPTP